MSCHLGDFAEYAELRRRLKDREAELSRQGAANRRAAAEQSLEGLRIGDVIRVPTGKRAGLAVVLDPGLSGTNEGPRPVVLTSDRQVARLSLVDFPSPVEALERIRIPKAFNARSPQSRRDLAASMRSKVPDPGGRPRRERSIAADDDAIARLRLQIRQHPCHGCAEREEHARWSERYQRLERETRSLEDRVESRTNTIARTFDRVCGLLESLGYLSAAADDAVTPDGERLARLYTELDLLAAECVRDGMWSGLTPPELAACVSALAYESRSSDDAAAPRLPKGRVQDVLTETVRAWGRLDRVEKDHGLAFLREPDLGFAWVAHRWASGARLEAVLREADMPAGDFVRWTKQLIDLLGQVGQAAGEADPDLRRTAEKAVAALRRGVVAYSSVG